MIEPEIEATIRRLYFADHWAVETIARQLHLYHSVVRRAVGLEGTRAPYPARPSMIEPYLPFVRETWERVVSENEIEPQSLRIWHNSAFGIGSFSECRQTTGVLKDMWAARMRSQNRDQDWGVVSTAEFALPSAPVRSPGDHPGHANRERVRFPVWPGIPTFRAVRTPGRSGVRIRGSRAFGQMAELRIPRGVAREVSSRACSRSRVCPGRGAG